MNWNRQEALSRAQAQLAMSLAGFAMGIDPAEIAAGTRGRAEAAFARQTAMYLCHVGLGMSLARTAAAFGRDRSTIGHASRLIEDRREDAAFDAFVEALEAAIRATPAPDEAGLKRLWREAALRGLAGAAQCEVA